jgi:nicotinate-nucleotide pyrophosphorylase (carboxylating)
MAEVEAGLAARAERLLLDNMGTEGLTAAVAARDDAERADGYRPDLEASGGVTLDSIGAISATGVDFVSVGALTHSATALDLSMLLEPA